MDNLYFGALGKTNSPGGSKFMTIPMTREITSSSYFIDHELEGDFVCCSLNGLLWLHENDNHFIITALKWNQNPGIIQFANSKTIDKEYVRARGIDWILLQNSFILVTDEEPYIKIATLINKNNSRFLYSILRSGVVSGSGIDPFTNDSWGKSSKNGNSEGFGYFYSDMDGLYPKNTHSLEACYSFLPAAGDWQIIEDFLVRRPSNPLPDNDYNPDLLQIRPLIPLEFNWFSDDNFSPSYGTGYSSSRRGVQLAMINGELWGRGFTNIGKVSILPAVFDENGNPQEFYLYISPEYKSQSLPNSNDTWFDIAITGTDNPIGFFSEKSSPINSGACVNSTSLEVFNIENNEWINPRPNDTGKLSFDISNGNGLALGEKGITFIHGDTYDCNNLSKWIAPTGHLESITNSKIISSSDNSLITTNIDTGFNRDLLYGQKLPISYCNFKKNNGSIIRTSIGEKNKKISVNEYINKAKIINNISWSNIYKNTINIQLANIINISYNDINRSFLDYYPLFAIEKNNYIQFYCFNSSTNIFDIKTLSTNVDIDISDKLRPPDKWERMQYHWLGTPEGTYWYNGKEYLPGEECDFGDGSAMRVWAVNGKIYHNKVYYYETISYYLSLDDYTPYTRGEPQIYTYKSYDLDTSLNLIYLNIFYSWRVYTIVIFRCGNHIYDPNNYEYIGSGESTNTYGHIFHYGDEDIKREVEIPEFCHQWKYDNNIDEGLNYKQSFFDRSNRMSIIFQEKTTNTNFCLNIPNENENKNNPEIYGYKNENDNRHLFLVFFDEKIFVFYTTVDYSIFDFKSELERSKLF